MGARFIYTDLGEPNVNAYFDRQWQRAGLRCVMSSTNKRVFPRVSEDKSGLGQYLGKFGGEMPKLQGMLTYRVLEKK